MTSGSVPPADDQASTSTKAPTDGPRTAGSFLITPGNLSDRLQQMYQYGWELARTLPGLESPPEMEFRVTIDHETRSVQVEGVIL